jgi:hypothetical protein
LNLDTSCHGRRQDRLGSTLYSVSRASGATKQY